MHSLQPNTARVQLTSRELIRRMKRAGVVELADIVSDLLTDRIEVTDLLTSQQDLRIARFISAVRLAKITTSPQHLEAAE